MSFVINFGRNSSEKNKIGKEVSYLSNMEGTLKDKTSIINPVILVNAGTEIHGYNYADIPSFGRKYFITDIVSVRNGLYEIHMHVDVLDSYKNLILSNNAIISRSESDSMSNMYINDGYYKLQSDATIDYYEFNKGFEDEQYYLTVYGHNKQN